MALWSIKDIPDQSGKLAIVTGATGGLGLETAIALAGAGAEVILAGRNPAKGRTAEALIRDRHRKAVVRFEQIDLASLGSVAAFAERMLTASRPIDILVNNAGVMAPIKRKTTEDGFEMQLGTNYLSHFALTGRLLPLLAAAKARVVQLSSTMHRGGVIRLNDLNYTQGYKPWPVYSQSKLTMLMFALELDRRSDAKGWGLTSVAAHPGVASTDLTTNGPNVDANPLMAWLTTRAARLLGHSAADGALPQLMAATMPGVKGGQYFGPQGWKEYKGPPGLGKIEPQALDRAVAAKLWVASESLTGVSFG
ncbi:short chain dehydrogenase [Rhizobium leguminosarum bv. trifolii]|uniref:SDR family oxidoreductase n=1 Tax=Rhizobium leguminosarum TaxID=384 RepID=UPI000E2E5A82|nr:SDR family oxidoreductase [Rhizobium leguminosarum]RFB88831.1 short chain dehydrogenase [Rhizobium leguminosarum bv. trifolii]